MKKLSVLALAAALALVAAACGGNGTQSTASTGTPLSTQTSDAVEPPSIQETPSPSKSTPVLLSAAEFEELLAQLPLFISSTQYVVQDEQYKSLYPDMLQAVLQNDTDADIKNAVVAFASWDKNGLPVKIKGSIDFSDGSYIKQVNYADINLVPGDSFGENSGFEISEDCAIATFAAVVVSFETFGGDTWENPYYDAWRTLYGGVKYSDSLSVEVSPADASFTGSSTGGSSAATPTSSAPEEELLAQLAEQPLRVVSTQYVVQDEQYKSLYPDMLQAVLQNDTDADIKNAVVAFASWDKNGLPVKIKGSIDFSDGSYIKQVNYTDINLVPGDSFGESAGFEVDEACGITHFTAMVASYETFEGDVWENPLFEDWCALYEGTKRP